MATGKILFLITELDIGGAEKTLFRLAVGLRGRGWDVEVACLSGRGPVGEWLEREGVAVHHIGMDFKASPAAFVRLVRLMRRTRPDILHTFLFHANVTGRLANVFARVGVVVSSVRVAERRRPSHLRMDYLTQFLMDREICVSEGVRDFTRDEAGITAEKLTVIPNPVEVQVAARSRRVVREELDVSDEEFLVLSVGRLEGQKGYVYLVEAAGRILQEEPTVRFVIAGGGREREAVEKAILDAGVGERFELLGWRADVADLYGAADLFVLPSLWEGMPNVLLEASAAGVAVVATDIEGSREVVADGETGLLVPARDAGALAKAIGRLRDDASFREKLAKAGKGRVLAEHDPEHFIASHEEVYMELLHS